MQREQNYYTPARMIVMLYEKARNNTLGNQRYKNQLDDESVVGDGEDSDEFSVEGGGGANLDEDEGFEDEFDEASKNPDVHKGAPKRIAYNPSQPEDDWLRQGFERLKGIKITTDGRWVLTGEQKKSSPSILQRICQVCLLTSLQS